MDKITFEAIAKLGYAGSLGAGLLGIIYVLLVVFFPSAAPIFKLLPFEWVLGVGALMGTGVQGLLRAIAHRTPDPARLFFENLRAIESAYRQGIIDKSQARVFRQQVFVKYLNDKNPGYTFSMDDQDSLKILPPVQNDESN